MRFGLGDGEGACLLVAGIVVRDRGIVFVVYCAAYSRTKDNR